MAIRELFDAAGFVLEALGVASIIAGMVLSVGWFFGRLRRLDRMEAYHQLRQNLARSIIIGLEFLIAGDIIRTVIVEQTLTAAAVLALIVAVRVILSLTLEYEIEGRLPWQRGRDGP